jgi:hypothetical protein
LDGEEWRTNSLDWLPFEGWSYLGLENRRTFLKVAEAYRQAHADLEQHYRRKFELSAQQAALAALRGLQVFAYEGAWGRPDRDGLRCLILGGAPTARIAAMLARVDDFQSTPQTRLSCSNDASNCDPPDPLLHVSVTRPDVLRLLLLAKKADPRETNAFRKTAAMAAAQENVVDALRLLLAAGAPVHAVTDGKNGDKDELESVALRHDTRSALHYAAARGDLSIIRLLLAAGADPRQPDSKGLRPIHYLVGDGPVPANTVLTAADFAEAARLLR